jgi:hypothetical protein
MPKPSPRRYSDEFKAMAVRLSTLAAFSASAPAATTPGAIARPVNARRRMFVGVPEVGRNPGHRLLLHAAALNMSSRRV